MTIPHLNTNKMMFPVSAGHTPKDLKKMPEQNEAKDPERHKLPKRTDPVWTTSFPQTELEGQVSTHIQSSLPTQVAISSAFIKSPQYAFKTKRQ